MLSIFRHAIDGGHSCSLLFRLQDSKQKSPYVVSRADARIRDLLRRSKEELLKTNLDQNLLKTYFEEVEKHGLPIALSSSDTSVLFDDADFGIHWDNFSLRRQDGSLLLEFSVPWIDEPIRFTLRSQTPRVDLKMLDSPGEQQMAYLTYPCCHLQGNYGGVAASGRGWFDHQWGELSWFVSGEDSCGQRRLLGWDWFGINLDNGMSVVIGVRRDMETRNILVSNMAIIRQGWRDSVY